MSANLSRPEPQKPLAKRIRRSVVRTPLPPKDDRGRMKLVMDSLILHLHPSRVSKSALKLTYTFGLGGLLILLLAVLVVTGVLLLFAYTPSPDAAYQSMVALQTRVYFGSLVRNLHHWSANLLLVAAVLHLLRVFYTAGFAPPREFNWVIGVALLLLAVAANFTGYLLPWDQLAYWAITVGTSLLGYIPLVGDALTRFLLGGAEVGAATLTNFYALHIALIPLSIFALVSLHIWRVRKDTLSVPRRAGEAADKSRLTTIPHLVSIEVVYALVWLALLVGWSAFVDAPLEAAANPAHSPNPAKAAWYFMGLQELLLHFHPLFGAIVIPGLGLLALLSVPYLERDMESAGVWFRSRRGRWLAAISFLAGTAAAFGWVLADEFWMDWSGWLPFLPSIISNGWIPFALVLLALMGYYELLRAVGGTLCESRQALFTFVLAAFLTLTFVGIFFRGAGMTLTLPWR